MKLTGYESEKIILKELGNRIKQHRISMDSTQAELAEKCGISMSTEVRIENGDDSKMSNYIRILAALGLLENFDMLVPEEKPDYKALFEDRKVRKRVSRASKKAEAVWVWGEDKGEEV